MRSCVRLRKPLGWLIAAVLVVALASILLALYVINGASPVQSDRLNFPSLADISASAWERLSQKRIYFGHQSVGFNILDGVRDVMGENAHIELNIVETSDPADIDGPMLAHSPIGQNTDPESKIDAFANLMETGMADKVDIALFKLCYVDVRADAEVDKTLARYKDVMARLKAEYPSTMFIHVTVPHTAIRRGFKAGVKRLIGTPVRGFDDNIKRCQLNDMLKKEYQGKEPVFDLAARETTASDGERPSFQKGGNKFHALIPEFTDDGGHLNGIGRKLVAEQFLILLASLSE